MDQPVITEDNPRPFVVRVKLLTNEVFDFEVDKNIKVADFKAIVSSKVNVPVDRMRIVFGGKQLLDDKPISQYVSESGLTVHLIARTAPQNEQPQSQPQSQPAQNPQPPLNNPPQVNNPFGDIMGMMGSLLGQPGQQGQALFGQSVPGQNGQINVSFGGLGNNALNGLLGNLGIRIPPPPQPPQSQQQQQQQPVQPQSQQNQGRISYAQIGQLNQALNNLNIPFDNITTAQETLTPEGVIRYLRRLHHQSTRSMLQLNRLLNLAENGNTSNLQAFIPVFQSLNSANNVAINCLNQLHNQRHQHQHQQSNQQQNREGNNQTVPPNINIPLMSFSIPLNPNQQQPVPLQQQQQNQNLPQNQPQQGQMPINPLNIFSGGGLNLGNLFGSLESVGGINGLFGLSLREMMTQNGQQQTNGILIDLFGGLNGQNIMAIFTTKNFTFLKQKQQQIRTNLKRSIDNKGQNEVIQQIVDEVSTVLIPAREHQMITNLNQCRQKCRKNLRRHVEKFVELTLNQNQTQYDLKLLNIGKQAFCENVNIISDYTTNKNANVAFQIIKFQAVSAMDPVLPGIAGIFYGLVERDLIRIYNEYKAQEERKKKMSIEDAQSEQQLIEMIKEVGAKDSQKLANMSHSRHYFREQ